MAGKQKHEYLVDSGNHLSVIAVICSMIYNGIQGGAVYVLVDRPGRTYMQNRKLWPMLQDIADQVVLNGFMFEKHEWKQILTAHWRGEQRLVLGIENKPVLLGEQTRYLSKVEFSDFIELMYCYGAEQNVTWSEKSKSSFEEHLKRFQESQ